MLLARERCHLSFFPSVWPETYCYTLSQAFFAGLYPGGRGAQGVEALRRDVISAFRR